LIVPPLIDSAQALPRAWRPYYQPFQTLAESISSISELNRLYERCQGGTPEDFAQKVLRDLGYIWKLPQKELLEAGSLKGPLLVLANHPMGGPEAVLMFLLLASMRQDYRIMANFMLARIPELKPSFLLMDPFDSEGSKSRNVPGLRQTLRYLKSGGLVGAFPAAEVSSWRFDEGRIADRDWSPQMARLALLSGASILPIYFEGGNDLIFQMAGLIHPRLRSLLLPRAVMRPARHEIRLRLGAVMGPAELKRLAAAGNLSSALRRRVYALSHS
jgi:putative hemolysin